MAGDTSQGMNGPYGSVGHPRSLREILLHPVMLLPIPVWILTVVGQRYGFVADHPVWLLVGALVLAQAATAAWSYTFPSGTERARPVGYLALEMTLIGVVVYLNGWGAVLGIGFVYAALSHMSINGSQLGKPAIAFTVVIVGAGELAIALGWLSTLQPEPEGHGLALLEVTGIAAVVWVMTMLQREKEVMNSAVRRSEERLRALVQHATDAIVVLDAHGDVMYASPAVYKMLGYAPEDLTRFDAQLLHPDFVDDAQHHLVAALERPNAVTWLEEPLRHADGTYRWFEIGLTNLIDDPAVGGLVVNMRDITERRSAQEELTFQAHHDALTKLPNRWHFLDELERAQRDARLEQHYVAVLFLDVDRFKMVNDSLGHEVGDRMLVAVSERLAACLRPRDVVARFGGDEFTILLRDLPDADLALRVADRVVEAMRKPLMIDGHDLFVSASVGVALSLGGADRASDLLRQADLAMYVAKEKGRARWELFDPSFAPHVMERLELEGDLWRALDHGELVVQFQPEVQLKTGTVVATEALLRWMHPRRGLLEPEKFVPLAEESSLIVAIDRYVLREACRWARRWASARPAEKPFIVSVNLSPRFMRQADVVHDITSVLRETGVDPRGIQLEITERMALNDLELTCSQLHQLRAIGVRVAVDDFGTGYSSLSYLKQLPIDVLKLDKSFVDSLDAGAADLAIVQAIVTMGHALGVKVTAEGVERPEQADGLRRLGCDSAMGWLWSKSVPPEQLGALAEAGFMPDGGPRTGVVVPLRARA